MLPSYIEDFKIKSSVKSINGIQEEKKENQIHLKVTLLAVEKKQTLDVDYVFNLDGLMIKHIITNVKNSE